MNPKVQLPLPEEAIVAVNYHCNARCRMCGIWKLEEDGSLLPDDYRKLPSSLRNVGITGGEPFLRDDIVDIVRSIYETVDGAQLIINSNGFLTGRIVAGFQAFKDMRPRVGIGLSLDGVGEMHDHIRGTRHAFQRVLQTIDELKHAGVRNIRISYTTTGENLSHLVKVYELSRKLGVEFSGVLAHNSKHYFHTDSNSHMDSDLLRQAYEIVNRRELTSRSIKSWFRAYYNHGTITYNAESRRLVSCEAARDFVFISPHGDVYPCIVIPEKMGSLKESTFRQIWHSPRADEVRSAVDGCEDCWMMCTARTSLKKNVLAAAYWVVKNKIKSTVSTYTE